jgi:large conductance mechanosensitive channel
VTIFLEKKAEIMKADFINFLQKYGVIGMAIAVIIGGKLNELVSSLVNDLLMPLIFQPLLAKAGVSDIRLLESHGIFYGRVLSASIDFLLVAFMIFIFIKKIKAQE